MTFPRVLSLILSKSRKSLQLVVNEFFFKLEESPVSASAFSQARAKFKHTAFIELNEDCVVDAYYKDGDYKQYKGFRLLSIDGSKLYLPNTKDIAREFGRTKVKNQYEESNYVRAQSSVLYDVLNEIVIDAQLGLSNTSERELAYKHLKHSKKGDLLLMDRGYSGYELFATIIKGEMDFLMRCPRNTFKEVGLFIDEKVDEKIVTICATEKSRKAVGEKQLPKSLKVRLIKVTLDTGEIEILATSLLDQEKHPIEDFKDLYFKRWGVETYFARIKGRLGLECFTGKTSESVRQDFFATIYISNMETVFTEDVNEELKNRSKSNKHIQKVNKAVSYNIIKNNIFDLLFDESLDPLELEKRIDEIFRTKSVAFRKNRDVDRNIATPRKRIRFHQFLKKFVF